MVGGEGGQNEQAVPHLDQVGPSSLPHLHLPLTTTTSVPWLLLKREGGQLTFQLQNRYRFHCNSSYMFESILQLHHTCEPFRLDKQPYR